MTDNLDNEIGWVKLAKAGDQTAFTKLVEQYQRSIYNLCYRMLHDTMAAEDATQETFFRAYVKLNTYNPAHRFSTWLFSIANHYCLDQLKRVRPPLVSWDDAPSVSLKQTDTAHQPESALLKMEVDSEIQQWLAALPAKERAAIVLKYWYQLSCEEIAQILNTTNSAIKSKLFRARKKMALVARQGQTNDLKPLTPRNGRQSLTLKTAPA